MKLPNFGYHLARAEGKAAREIYRASLPMIVRQPIRTEKSFPLEVFAYSGESALPEQVASLRSFIENAGRPKSFTIVSDGSYSPRSIELLKKTDPSVRMAESRAYVPAGLPEPIYPYLTSHPTGKQLALIMSLAQREPALYLDSDILFFSQARELADLAGAGGPPAYYLEDCQLSGDARILHDEEKARPVNTGFLLLFRPLDWSLSISRFLEMHEPPIFFTNQTMTHLTMHANGAAPLDPRKFILQLDDQFIYPDRYAGPSIALRHYVNPVRHKFWTRFARGRA
jgi:hypothetical protein